MFRTINISRKYSNAWEPYLFRSSNGITEENLGTHSEMSALSSAIPQHPGCPIAASTQGNATPELSANEISCYRIATYRRNGVRKILLPANLNARSKIWMSRDLVIYSKSEYVYATLPGLPIALSMFWGKGGREIPTSEESSMIFTILSH